MIIKNDLFNIASRVKEIDDGYFIEFNTKLNRYELHHKKSKPTFELVLPFSCLDARTLYYVRLTRIAPGGATFARIERENERIEKENAERMRDQSVFNLRHSLGVLI